VGESKTVNKHVECNRIIWLESLPHNLESLIVKGLFSVYLLLSVLNKNNKLTCKCIYIKNIIIYILNIIIFIIIQHLYIKNIIIFIIISIINIKNIIICAINIIIFIIILLGALV
jgi:hypothetical protein